jgi:hypothetical protein
MDYPACHRKMARAIIKRDATNHNASRMAPRYRQP